jgi:glycosyltransferase involved in cell wall biosynthesis
MRVLLVNDYAARFGGAERMVFRLRDILRARGHDVRVFTSSAGGVEDADYSCVGTLGPLRTLLQTANPHAAVRLRQVLAGFRPDVVSVKLFLTQLSPLVLPMLASVPSVYHAVWYRAVCPTGTKRLPDGALCRVAPGTACYRHGCVPLRDWIPLMGQMQMWRRWRGVFDRVVANSEWTRRVLIEGGITPVEVIPNGVPVVLPRPPLSEPPTVMFAGRLTADKGVDVLLRAFARLAIPNARLVVAGDGPEREGLGRLSEQLGLGDRVTWCGHVEVAALEARASRAWVQVVPSVWAEPFGLVSAEAAMRGTATIATDIGGSAEIVVDGRTGLLTRPQDVDALTAAMRRLLSDRALAEALGEAARARALMEYRDDLYADRCLGLFDQIRRR